MRPPFRAGRCRPFPDRCHRRSSGVRGARGRPRRPDRPPGRRLAARRRRRTRGAHASPAGAARGAEARGGGAAAGARVHAVEWQASARSSELSWPSWLSAPRFRFVPPPSPSFSSGHGRRGYRDDVSASCYSIVPLRRRDRCLQVQVLLPERQPRWAPSPWTFWIETSARKISFVRARCSNAAWDGGAERARQVVDMGKHLPTGYQPAPPGLLSGPGPRVWPHER
jgi:hypothetical protein